MNEAINLLEIAGINFKFFQDKGMGMDRFGELLTTSGMVLNENVKWIIFHGSYDLAYLIKILSNQPLPEEEIAFNELLGLYFPTFYDVRYLIKNFSWLKGSLSKISTDLDIARVGTSHQAGSDSLVTAKVFHKLMSNFDLISDRNKLFGFTYKNAEDYEGYPFNGNYSTYNPYNIQGGGIINKTTNKNMVTPNTVYGYQNLNGFNQFNNFTNGAVSMNNLQNISGMNNLYCNMNGFNSMYPQHLDYNYYGNFYNGNNANNAQVPQKSGTNCMNLISPAGKEKN